MISSVGSQRVAGDMQPLIGSWGAGWARKTWESDFEDAEGFVQSNMPALSGSKNVFSICSDYLKLGDINISLH